MSVAAPSKDAKSNAGVITNSQSTIFLKMTYDLENIKDLPLDQLTEKLNQFYKRLDLNEIDTAIDLIFKRAITTSTPNLILAALKSTFMPFNFRAKLAGCFTPETFDRLAAFLKFFIRENNGLVVRELILSLMKHSIANVIVKNFKTLPPYFLEKFSAHLPFEGLDAILVSEMVHPTPSTLQLDSKDDCTLLYFLGRGLLKSNSGRLTELVVKKLESLPEPEKIAKTVRLIEIVCLINEEHFFYFITDVIKNIKLEHSTAFQIEMTHLLVRHLEKPLTPVFLGNFTALWNLFPEIDGHPFYFICLKSFLAHLSKENGHQINTLLSYANSVDSSDVYSLCFSIIAQKDLYSCVDKKMPFPRLFHAVIDIHEGMSNPNLVVKGDDSSFGFNCHTVVLKTKAPKIYNQCTQVMEKEKTVLVVPIKGMVLVDIFGILYQKFWNGKKFNPDWNLESMAVVYKEAKQWELSEVRASCFEFLRNQKYTAKDFDTILKAFSPMTKEELEKLLSEYKVFLAP